MVNFYKFNLILEEQEEKVLIPRRSKEEREKNYILGRGLIVEKPTYNYKDPLNLIKSFYQS